MNDSVSPSTSTSVSDPASNLKVLLVNAGPHKRGCTNRALEEVASALEGEGVGSDIFWVGTKPLGSCMACRLCAKTGRCVFDDRVNEFLDIVCDYDGYVLGTPVHWGSSTGAAASFFDRAFYALGQGGSGPVLRMRPGAAVASCRRAGNTATIDQMNKYFQLMQMPIVTSRYWNIVHGATAEQVEQDLEGLQTMRILGRNMAYLVKVLAAAREAGIELPELEPTTFTNFVR